MEDVKAVQVINKLSDENYQPNDVELKDLFSGIQKSQGTLVKKITDDKQKLKKMYSIMSQKMVDLDLQFYHVFFQLIKTSNKWSSYKADFLMILFIPKLISIHVLLNFQEKNDDRVQSRSINQILFIVTEVVLFAYYSEFFEQINQREMKKELDSQQQIIDLFPQLKKQFESEFKEVKKQKHYIQISGITPSNINEIYECLLELFQTKILEVDIKVINDFISMGFILCGAKLTLNQLMNDKCIFNIEKLSLFLVQISEKTLETLIVTAFSINTLFKINKQTPILIEALLRKCSNECRFQLAGFAQSTKELTENLYDGIF